MFMIQSIMLATAGVAKSVDKAVKSFDSTDREKDLERYRKLSYNERHYETVREFTRNMMR